MLLTVSSECSVDGDADELGVVRGVFELRYTIIGNTIQNRYVQYRERKQ